MHGHSQEWGVSKNRKNRWHKYLYLTWALLLTSNLNIFNFSEENLNEPLCKVKWCLLHLCWFMSSDVNHTEPWYPWVGGYWSGFTCGKVPQFCSAHLLPIKSRHAASPVHQLPLCPTNPTIPYTNFTSASGGSVRERVWKCLRLGVIGCHLPFDHFHFGTAFVALADSLSFKTCGWLVAWENELMLAGDAYWKYLLVMLTGSTVRNALSTEIAIGRYISFPWATGHL